MPPQRRQPTNVVAPVPPVTTTEAERLLNDLTGFRRNGGVSRVGFHLCVLDENGQFSLLSFETLHELRQTLVGYIGREVMLRAFVGAPLPLSAAIPSQPLMRYLMIPGQQPLPLFDAPADLAPDEEGYVGPMYRTLTAPMELRSPEEEDEQTEQAAPASRQDPEGDDFPDDDEEDDDGIV